MFNITRDLVCNHFDSSGILGSPKRDNPAVDFLQTLFVQYQLTWQINKWTKNYDFVSTTINRMLTLT